MLQMTNNNNFNDKINVVLTEKALNDLKEICYDEVNKKITIEDKCTICFTELSIDTDKHKYIVLPCNHVYHSECIKEYLKSYDYHCPLCRKAVGESISKI